jgi:hypothetical protein
MTPPFPALDDTALLRTFGTDLLHIAAVTDMGGIPDLDADRRWLLAVGYGLLAG